jgi:hypothetical protein
MTIPVKAPPLSARDSRGLLSECQLSPLPAGGRVPVSIKPPPLHARGEVSIEHGSLFHRQPLCSHHSPLCVVRPQPQATMPTHPSRDTLPGESARASPPRCFRGAQPWVFRRRTRLIIVLAKAPETRYFSCGCIPFTEVESKTSEAFGAQDAGCGGTGRLN